VRAEGTPGVVIGMQEGLEGVAGYWCLHSRGLPTESAHMSVMHACQCC
jgi:hypothetical protein